MIQQITLNDFRHQVMAIRPNSFSHEGLKCLYNLLENINPNFELDVIALCCEFSEYESFEELQADYSDYETLSDFQDDTLAIEVGNGSIIIQQF